MKAILDKAVPLKGAPEISLSLTAPKSEWAALQELQRADPNPELMIISVAEYERLSGTNPAPDVLEAVTASELRFRISEYLLLADELTGRLLDIAEATMPIGYYLETGHIDPKDIEDIKPGELRIFAEPPLSFDGVPLPMGCERSLSDEGLEPDEAAE